MKVKTMTDEEMAEIAEEINTYAEHDDDSYSELMINLCEFYWRMSDEFLESYKKEIVSVLENYKKHYDIVTEEVTDTYKQTFLKSK